MNTERQTIIHKIALQFAANLDADMGIDLVEIDLENATREFRESTCCASHNHCDANMYMAPAWESVMGREIDLQSDEDVTLWNDAWEHAKDSGFVALAKEADGNRRTHDFEASTHSLNPHVIDASRPYDDVIKDIVRLIALAIEGSEDYVAKELRGVVERVYQSEDVLWTLREQLPDCEWFECYERLYNAGLLLSVE